MRSRTHTKDLHFPRNPLFCIMFCNYSPKNSTWSLAIAILLLTCLIWSCGEDKPGDEFIISGNISNYPSSQQIRLDQLFPDRIVGIDSMFLDENGSFRFQHKNLGGEFYQIRFQSGYSFPFYPGTNELEFKVDHLNPRGWTLTGSDESLRLKDFLSGRGERFANYRKEKQALKMIPKVQELERWREAEKRTDLALIEFRTFLRTYMDTVTIPEFRAFAAFSGNMDGNYHYLQGIRERLEGELPSHPFTKTLGQQLDAIGNAFVRIEPQDIVGENPEGKEVHLKDEVGKMTLVNFWAGYCAYSRQENQILKELYGKYKDQGFSIFSLSVDDDPQVWRNAIQEDGLTWPGQIWLQKGWEAQVFAEWDVPSVPTTFLLDHRGVIMSKNIRATELRDNMDELLARYMPGN